ncbi:MAG: tetratricopeptide repeat protein, partial [Verrucomicrobia bacterium]|nr:tetratricopeptide repeat protein [Verrucomicrobiota bacterium]
WQEAIDCYESATRHPAPMPQTFVRLALLYIDSDLARSIQILIDSADVLPNDPLPLLALGQIYSNRGRYDEALATYERLETISRNNAEWRLPPAYYLHYGSTAERAGLFELAERLFETCISTYPNSHQVLNYLAYMWADRGIKLEKALQYVNRALIHEPQNGAYLDTRGWIYYMQGDYQEALIHIEAASKLIPEDPTINDHLGDIWSALGDRTRAVQHWSQSYIRDTANTTVANKLQANGVDPDSLQPAIEPTEDN